jgi:4-hydroxy-3-methylbut-2-enyl diphosphate reductase
MEVLRYARDGYTIIFVGHRNHDEAVGTVGEAPDHIVIVESAEEAERLTVADPERVAFVTQTTLSVSDAMRVIDVLKRRFPKIRHPEKDDICYATTNRQNAVTEWSPDVDLVIVLGSQNSSNSLRLVERAKEQGRPAYLVDDETELKPEWFAGKRAVLVTAGASAPEHLVANLIARIQRDFGGREVETRTLAEEDVAFSLPKSARSLTVLGAR